MRSLFFSELNKLKYIQNNLEKHHLSNCDEEVDINGYFLQLERNRNCELESLYTNIKDVTIRLQEQRRLMKENCISGIDLGNFKKSMVEIQDNLQSLKIQLRMNLQNLEIEGRNLFEYIEPYNHKLLEWETNASRNTNFNHKIQATVILNQDFHCKEVKEFMDFVTKSKGHENGWEPADHNVFLKLRNKYKSNLEALAENLHNLMPDLSIETIMEHELWYKKYISLRNKKLDALEKWRNSKKENISCNTNVNDNIIVDHKISNIHNDKNWYSSDSTRLKLATWKAEKEAKRHHEECIAHLQRERLLKIQQEKRKLFLEVKESVKKWKDAKAIKEQNEKFQREMIDLQEKKIRAIEANKLIKEFQSQDDFFIMRKKTLKPIPKEIIRSTSSYSVDRDPNRLFKPTKQWLLRINNDIDNNKLQHIPNIRLVPKLKVPEWRKK